MIRRNEGASKRINRSREEIPNDGILFFSYHTVERISATETLSCRYELTEFVFEENKFHVLYVTSRLLRVYSGEFVTRVYIYIYIYLRICNIYMYNTMIYIINTYYIKVALALVRTNNTLPQRLQSPREAETVLYDVPTQYMRHSTHTPNRPL